jgi:hypothetical protein
MIEPSTRHEGMVVHVGSSWWAMLLLFFLPVHVLTSLMGIYLIDKGDFFCRGLGELSDAGAFRMGIMNIRYLLKASGFPIRHDRFQLIFETSLFGNGPLKFGCYGFTLLGLGIA